MEIFKYSQKTKTKKPRTLNIAKKKKKKVGEGVFTDRDGLRYWLSG